MNLLDRRRRCRRGFTLVETLVSISLAAVIAAALYPVVIQQLQAYNALRVARDLDHLRRSIRAFQVSTWTFPRYVDQLAIPVTESDVNAADEPYTTRQVDRWSGPYLDRPIEQATARATFIAFPTGFDGSIINDLICFDVRDTSMETCSPQSHLVILVQGLYAYQFDQINPLIDGDRESLEADGDGTSPARTEGRLRFVFGSGSDYLLQPGTVLYFASPITRSIP